MNEGDTFVEISVFINYEMMIIINYLNSYGRALLPGEGAAIGSLHRRRKENSSRLVEPVTRFQY